MHSKKTRESNNIYLIDGSVVEVILGILYVFKILSKILNISGKPNLPFLIIASL